MGAAAAMALVCPLHMLHVLLHIVYNYTVRCGSCLRCVCSFDDPSAPLPQRLLQHHALYGVMRQRCQDFLDGHPQ